MATHTEDTPAEAMNGHTGVNPHQAPKEDIAHLEKTTSHDRSSSENGGNMTKEGHGVDPDEPEGKLTARLFLALMATSFLWVGSQIPLYLFGGILTDIYGDIGGYDIWVWFPIAYFIPVAAVCPFVGVLSDLFGRKWVGMTGQLFLIVGPVVVSTAHNMNVAVGGMVISGFGAGLNELIALAATGEMVPTAKRGLYVGAVVLTIIPFAPSVLWAELIQNAASWRWVGAFVAGWNLVGLILLALFYNPPPRPNSHGHSKREILKRVDYVGAVLSICGITTFMMGLQWGAQQYSWKSVHVLVPFLIGCTLIISYFFWEVYGAKYPMVPPAIFSRAKRTMIATLLITFISGANFFNMLLFWPTEIYNVYGNDYVGIGIRSLPVGFGILGGAVISLVLIPVTKGNVRGIMLFFTAMMTAGTGAVAIANPDNIHVAYAPVCLACIGVGGVIIPVAIIAQIICPDELLGTITAISLSIRFVGGAIGFSIYYNVFYRKVFAKVQDEVAVQTITYKLGYVEGLASGDLSYITALAQSIAQAQYEIFNNLSAIAVQSSDVQTYNPGITVEEFRYQITNATEWAFASAYRWPYWISIPFGATCVILSFFLGDLAPFLTEHVAVHV